MKEDFVSYDLAVKLKEKGFREKCKKHCYPNSQDWFISSMPECDNYSNYLDIPTIYQVLKWLREEKKLFVNPSLFKDGYESFVQSTVFEDGKDYTDMWRVEGFYPTYEQAAIAGIEYVINNLI